MPQKATIKWNSITVSMSLSESISCVKIVFQLPIITSTAKMHFRFDKCLLSYLSILQIFNFSKDSQKNHFFRIGFHNRFWAKNGIK